ncbi:MAG: rhodanese-like domain-containing protein [Bacteroidota bacterium]|jgi:rhodanese-related sulfurtransferase
MGSIVSLLLGSRLNVANLDSETFEKMLKETEDSVILDVRTKEEYCKKRIPDSILIDIYKPDFLSRLEKLNRGKTYFVYCRSGSRSFNAAVKMLKLGFTKIFNLENGISNWSGPVESN